MVARKPAFMYPRLELYAPARGNNLDPVARNQVNTHRTDSMTVAVAKDRDTGEKQVLLIFPKVGYHYAITTVSELQRIRDGIDAILDQVRRPHLEVI